jgi:hypothetical protein
MKFGQTWDNRTNDNRVRRIQSIEEFPEKPIQTEHVSAVQSSVDLSSGEEVKPQSLPVANFRNAKTREITRQKVGRYSRGNRREGATLTTNSKKTKPSSNVELPEEQTPVTPLSAEKAQKDQGLANISSERQTSGEQNIKNESSVDTSKQTFEEKVPQFSRQSSGENSRWGQRNNSWKGRQGGAHLKLDNDRKTYSGEGLSIQQYAGFQPQVYTKTPLDQGNGTNIENLPNTNLPNPNPPNTNLPNTNLPNPNPPNTKDPIGDRVPKTMGKYKWAKYAVGATVLGGLVLSLSDSRGQQTNAQLYGQRPLY